MIYHKIPFLMLFAILSSINAASFVASKKGDIQLTQLKDGSGKNLHITVQRISINPKKQPRRRCRSFANKIRL